MLLRAIQDYNQEDLVTRLDYINERINSLIKQAANPDDIDRLRQLRVLVEQEQSIRECEEILK